ncbi:MAG: MGMT family protein [Candidatus Kariarchaeaceae archaeon]|jgi:methylated-DNA-protein-cysteine methyltransferase-like protein
MQEFTKRVIGIIQDIPEGKVTTYGTIARLAGSPRAARQVTRILHTQSKKYNLPWFRIVNSQGKIAIKDPEGAEHQKNLLLSEGVEVNENLKVNIKKFGWVMT